MKWGGGGGRIGKKGEEIIGDMEILGSSLLEMSLFTFQHLHRKMRLTYFEKQLEAGTGLLTTSPSSIPEKLV